MKRKLLFFVLSFFAGCGFCILNCTCLLIPFSCLAIPAALYLSIRYGQYRHELLFAFLFFYWGVAVFSLSLNAEEKASVFGGRWVTVEGTVSSVQRADRFMISVEEMSYRGIETGYKGRLMVLPGGKINVVPGQNVVVTGRVKAIGDNDYRNYYRGAGAAGILQSYPQYVKVLPGCGNRIRCYSYRAAGWIKEGIERAFTPEKSEIARGLLLGGREVSPDTRGRFSSAGVSHLLAVSGLHVGIIAGVLVWLTRRAGFPPGLRFLAICLLLVLFCFMVGLTPSVIRASVMASIVLLGVFVNRQQDALTSLVFTAFLLVVGRPFIIYSISFQLSFLACLGLILFYPVFRVWFQFAGSYTARGLSLTLSSQILLLPLLINYFGYITPVSLLTNLLVIPLAAVLLWCIIIFLFFWAAGIPLYMPTAQIGGIIIDIMNYIVQTAGSIPWGNFRAEAKGTVFLMVYYGTVCILLIVVNLRNTIGSEVTK